MMHHEQSLLFQAQQSVACMAAHTIEARLARWLLRSRLLAQSDNLPFTQEFLAEMLGVRRTSVSMVAKELQRSGTINYVRGKILIKDVKGLQQMACECYDAVQLQYDSLVGSKAHA